MSSAEIYNCLPTCGLSLLTSPHMTVQSHPLDAACSPASDAAPLAVGAKTLSMLPCLFAVRCMNLPAGQLPTSSSALQVSLLVSAFYLGLAAVQAGLLTNFLSHSVISGFTSGASIIIATTQVGTTAVAKITSSVDIAGAGVGSVSLLSIWLEGKQHCSPFCVAAGA